MLPGGIFKVKVPGRVYFLRAQHVSFFDASGFNELGRGLEGRGLGMGGKGGYVAEV